MEHYHNYQIVKQGLGGIVEVCTECKHKLTTRMGKTGRVDNLAYLKEHARDTAQPGGSTDKLFKRFYGNVRDRVKVKKAHERI